MDLAHNIKKYREKMTLSEQELASRLHVSESEVISWEKGEKEPSLKELNALSRLFNVTLKELSGDSWNDNKIRDEQMVDLKGKNKEAFCRCNICGKSLYSLSERHIVSKDNRTLILCSKCHANFVKGRIGEPSSDQLKKLRKLKMNLIFALTFMILSALFSLPLLLNPQPAIALYILIVIDIPLGVFQLDKEGFLFQGLFAFPAYIWKIRNRYLINHQQFWNVFWTSILMTILNICFILSTLFPYFILTPIFFVPHLIKQIRFLTSLPRKVKKQK